MTILKSNTLFSILLLKIYPIGLYLHILRLSTINFDIVVLLNSKIDPFDE